MEKTGTAKEMPLLYPFLIALFPLISATSRFKNEITKPTTVREILFLAVVLFSVTFALYLLLKFILKDRYKAALAVGIFVACFFLYTSGTGYIAKLFKTRFPEYVKLLIFSGVTGSLIFAAVRTRRDLRNFTRIIQFSVLVFFFMFSYKSIAYFTKVAFSTVPQLRKLGAFQDQQVAQLIRETPDTSGKMKPDIYYIVLDRYTSSRNLDFFYGYNNCEFTEFLESKGFFVAYRSLNNYPVTALSLASSLNMDHLDFLNTLFGGKEEDYRLAYYLIEHNRTAKFLKAQGYKYIYMGAYWEPTSYSGEADENIFYSPLKKYTSKLLSMTPFDKPAQKLPGGNALYNHWQRENNKFEQLARIPEMREPTFTFAHVLIPHEPFAFDKNGRLLVSGETGKRTSCRNYTEQVACVSKKVRWAVTRILERSDNPPVIIVQGDEGPYPANFRSSKMRGPELHDFDLKKKVGILNAYYIPDIDRSKFYQTITPVNSFRLVLNRYFDTKLPLLPDETFIFSDWSHLYSFTNITKRVSRDLPIRRPRRMPRNQEDDWGINWR